MAAYSMDLRTRVLADWDGGLSAEALAAKYRVSRAWVDRFMQRRRETGAVGPRRQTTFRRRALAGQEERLASACARRAGSPPCRAARRVADDGQPHHHLARAGPAGADR